LRNLHQKNIYTVKAANSLILLWFMRFAQLAPKKYLYCESSKQLEPVKQHKQKRVQSFIIINKRGSVWRKFLLVIVL